MQWFWKRRFLKERTLFSLFRYQLLFKWGLALHLIPSPKDVLEIGSLVLEKKWWWSCEKFTMTTTTTTYNGQFLIRKAHLSLIGSVEIKKDLNGKNNKLFTHLTVYVNLLIVSTKSIEQLAKPCRQNTTGTCTTHIQHY